jgi:multidrug efflux system outer membrane protein
VSQVSSAVARAFRRRASTSSGRFFSIALLVLAWPATAAAQNAPRAQAAAPRSGPSAAPADDVVVAPEVSDSMLSPVETAPRVVRTWEEALTLIRTRSPDYITGAETIRRAEAQKRIALATVLPTLNGQGSYTHQFLTKDFVIGPVKIESPPPNVWAAGATLSVPIVNARGLYGVATANRNIEAAKLSFKDQRREITTTVVNAMLASLTAERVAELNRVGLRSALERLSLTESRLKFGQGTELDHDRALQDVAAARAQLISGDESLRQAREELGRALGLSAGLGVPRNLDLEEFERAVARTCHLNEDLERRPDVAAARKRVEVADRAITDAELEIAPTLSAVSTLNHASEVALSPNTTWLVQGVLNVPFYDGGARYGRMRDAKAALEQARQALASTRLNAVIASARAHRAVVVSQQSRDVALTQRDLAQRVDARTREGFARGFGTSLDLVISAQALRQAEIDLAVQDLELGEARAGAVLANAECVY